MSIPPLRSERDLSLGNSIDLKPELPSPPSLTEISLLLSAVMSAYCVLYGPQVMITRWVDDSLLSPHAASSLVYLTLFPMSLAPLCYGYLLGQVETKLLISQALSALGITSLALSLSHTYAVMATMRLTQGFILPIIMTAVMSRLSSYGEHRGSKLITYYLCATVLGGLLGRILSGYLTDSFGINAPWFLWSGLLLTISFCLTYSKGESIPYNAQICNLARLKRAVSLSSVRPSLLCGALTFGVFAAALNLLPLRALELDPQEGSIAIAHRYWGYLAGVVVALSARSLNRALRGGGRAPAIGLFIIMIALYWGSLDRSSSPLSGMVLLLCIGLFITHPLLAAHMTQLSPQERGLMSGLYVSSYYVGGALSSTALSFIYQGFGWQTSLAVLAVLSIIGAVLAFIALGEDKG